MTSRESKPEPGNPIKPRRIWLLLGLAIALPICAIYALIIGPMDLSVGQILSIFSRGLLWSEIEVSKAASVVIWEIRLPRVFLSSLVGCGLAMAGCAMQGVFRNPLADPGIIGVSGGGAIGAITMIVIGGRILSHEVLDSVSLYLVPISAMIGAILMTFLIYQLSQKRGNVDMMTMLLVGIAINALTGAFIGYLTFISDDQELRTLTFWNLGSLGRANWELIIPALIFIIPPIFLLPRYSNSLNALLLSETDARYLGVDTARTKRILIALSAALVGVTVALCGGIGFIALVAPHMIRSAIGPDHRFLMPCSSILGAILLTLGDVGSRTLAAPAELPIGILTSLIGAPVFLYILIQRKKRSAFGA
ncbi:MAG: iron ABC transporter permease [Verrucomicrobiota bacterium]